MGQRDTQQPLTVLGNRCCNRSPDAEPGTSLAAGVGSECGAARSPHRALSHYCRTLGLAIGRWDREGLPLGNSEAGSGLLLGLKDTQKEHKAVSLTERPGGRCLLPEASS